MIRGSIKTKLVMPASALAAAIAVSAAIAQGNNTHRPLDLDLTGGTAVWTTSDGSIFMDGKKISCAQLKAKYPAYFIKSGANKPIYDRNCKPVAAQKSPGAP